MDNNEIWRYFEKNEDWLLRYRLSGESNKIMRFEILNTKTVSENDEMYFNDYNKQDFIEILNVPKNYDIYTFLDTLFETKSPECTLVERNNEYILKITTNKGDKAKITLTPSKCEDNEFLEKNRKRKIEQIEKKMKEKFEKIDDENEKLNKRNEELEKELEQISKINIQLSQENEKISTKLSKLKETQEKAINQLQELIK